MNQPPPTEVTVSCNTCGSRDFFVLASIPINHPNWHAKGSSRAVICNQCGLVYLSPRLSSEGYRQFYRESFSAHQNTPDTLASLISKKYLREKNRLLRTVMPLLDPPPPRDASVLDIGCGYGELLGSYQQHYGGRIKGVELGTYAAKYAREHFGVDILEIDINQDFHVQEQFDLVFFIAVIEHVLDPVGVLKNIRKLLKPNGALVVLTPDLSHITPLVSSKDLGRVIKPVHTYYFTQDTLALTGHLAGLACSRIDSGPHISTTQHDLLAVFKNQPGPPPPSPARTPKQIKADFEANVQRNDRLRVRLPYKCRYYARNPALACSILQKRWKIRFKGVGPWCRKKI